VQSLPDVADTNLVDEPESRPEGRFPFGAHTVRRFPVRVVQPNPVELSNPNTNPRFIRLLRIFKYLAVPGSLVSCCKYSLLPLCYGRGREFESRRPRHFFLNELADVTPKTLTHNSTHSF
jgi:hypothetical protein